MKMYQIRDARTPCQLFYELYAKAPSTFARHTFFFSLTDSARSKNVHFWFLCDKNKVLLSARGEGVI